MPKIPKAVDSTANKLEFAEIPAQPRRNYLSLSRIGVPCSRALFYDFHFCSEPETLTPRQMRIFRQGHLEEALVISDLMQYGHLFCYIVDNGQQIPITGDLNEKQELIKGFENHARGHIDGRVIGLIENPHEEHILEIKTAQKTSFNKTKKHGVEKAHPIYYAQMQRYMHGTGLFFAFFVMSCKDNQERYYEIVEYNESVAKDLITKEIYIIASELLPPKLSENADNYHCRFCQHSAVCHERKSVEKNCRTCDHSDLIQNGGWHCSRWNKKLSDAKQLKGCEFWQIGWGL